MALSGSLSGGIFTSISWTATQNKEGNYSVVKTTLTVGGSAYELTKRGGTKITLTVNGHSKTMTAYGPGQTLSSTATVRHEDDGTAGFRITASYSNYGEDQSGSINKWFYLNTIPRGAQIDTVPSKFTDESNPAISYKYQAGDSAHSIEALITTNNDPDNLTVLVTRTLAKTSSSNAQAFTFTLTEEERDKLRLNCKTANSKTLYIGVRTVIGGKTFYSSKASTFSVIGATPTVKGSVVDVNPVSLALTGDASTLIRFVSSAKASMSVAVFKKAAIKSYQIEHNANVFPVLEQTFEQVEGNAFGFKLTDSRGNTVEDFIQSPMIEYTRLTCNIDVEERPDANGEMNIKCAGNYFNDTFGFSDAAIANTLQVQYRYKEQNGDYTPWINIPYSINDNNTYNGAFTLTGLDYTKTYVFQCRAIDKLLTIESVELIAKALPVFHWGEDDFVFEVPVSFRAGCVGCVESEDPDNFNGDFNIEGNLRLKGAGNYGNAIYFGDASYCYLKEATDDALTIKASKVNLDATVSLRDQPLTSGTWFPTLSGNAVTSYTTNEGWYQQVGNTVTVGFFIKATCASGYETTGITINGLPITPRVTASGGGMCSGAYVSAGFDFQCWAAAVGNTITARVQACNNTSAKNLSTSASGCFFPKGGGEITLSGTISYRAL